jgi:hypothetical protein
VSVKRKIPGDFSGDIERLAATYSRGSYTTTTIGHAAFDGRVRDGNGSDHCGIATKLVRTILTCKIICKDHIRSVSAIL